MPQRRSLSLIMAEVQLAAAVSSGVAHDRVAVMSKFSRRKLWKEPDVSSLLMLVHTVTGSSQAYRLQAVAWQHA